MTFSHYKEKNISSGFTLVEMLVYVSLLVVISTAAVASLISMSDSFQQQKARQLVTRNATVVIERLLSDIRSAGDVDQLNSTLESSPGELTLLRASTTTSYAVSSGVLEVSVNGASSAVSDSAVTIDSLRFYVYDNTVTEMVRVEITLSATAGLVTHTQTFNAGAVLRGSYE